ncbi:Aste57867_12306 [Aphanomyces stellatus]|uniref:Aste57867_12306 protein n=1 Tax=Aphanomyces stellatus TaxID=120398 RepID=A0A485KWL0_9STRA|nr:hypothetical protein As57867_012260 [Aphanomyces stellatus]VFT89158.1 Aste57867_12306 [Aphanomyces stellatus]
MAASKAMNQPNGDTWQTVLAAALGHCRAASDTESFLRTIQLMQFASLTTAYIFLTQSILDDNDPTWSLFGWVWVVEWLQVSRKVLSFDATRVFLSKAFTPLSFKSVQHPNCVLGTRVLY